jgi:hypothetical protein
LSLEMKRSPSHGLSSSPSSMRDIDTVDPKSEDIELSLRKYRCSNRRDTREYS